MESDKFEPFPGSWALQAGMTRGQLAYRYKRVFPDVWIDKRAVVDFRTRTLAAGHWMKGDGVLCGFSAAVLHGSKWIDAATPAEIMTRRRSHGRPDLIIRRQVPLAHELTEAAGFQVTTPGRTAYDLARQLEFDPAVIAIDAIANAVKSFGMDDILKVLDDHPVHRRRAHIRAVAEAIDAGADSPQETRTRLALVDFGLPRPETQITVRDHNHQLIGHADMGYRRWRVLIEYEGGQHDEDDQLVVDIERYHRMSELGWTVIRVTKPLLRSPWLLADRVETALRLNGWSD